MEKLNELGIPVSFVINTTLLLTLGLLLWAVTDISKRNFSSTGRFIWLLLIVLLPILGAGIYLVFGRKRLKQPD